MNRPHLTLAVCMLLLANPDPAAADKLPQVQSGRIERLADFEPSQVPPRHIDVWLPDGYPADGP
jgi:hypothetical protein